MSNFLLHIQYHLYVFFSFAQLYVHVFTCPHIKAFGLFESFDSINIKYQQIVSLTINNYSTASRCA